MAVKIRLRRTGKRNAPAHRIVVTDGRSPRDGRFIEILGTYDPRAKAETIDLERADYWLGQGAQPSETVAAIVKRARAGMPMTPVVQTKSVAAEPAEPAAAEPAADETAEETTEEPASEPATPEDSGEESDDDDAKEADA